MKDQNCPVVRRELQVPEFVGRLVWQEHSSLERHGTHSEKRAWHRTLAPCKALIHHPSDRKLLGDHLCGGWEWVGQAGTDEKNHHVGGRRLEWIHKDPKAEAWKRRQELVVSSIWRRNGYNQELLGDIFQ